MRGSLISERNEMKRKWQWHATRSRVYRDSTCSTRVPIWMKFEIANSILIDLRFVIDLRSSAWKWCRYLQAKRSEKRSREIESLSKCNFSTFANEHGVTLSLVDLAIVNFDQTKHFVSFKPESFDSITFEREHFLFETIYRTKYIYDASDTT